MTDTKEDERQKKLELERQLVGFSLFLLILMMYLNCNLLHTVLFVIGISLLLILVVIL